MIAHVTAQLFREPKSSGELGAVLDGYAADIAKVSHRGGGVITSRFHCCCSLVLQGTKCFLSCVVGGKMSEGINFADNLAR